ncbi:Proteasome assembly chaperone 2 [Papilio machaon]|uniref:Proteasome assembly chaperone 2 n=1 Tax=Papilio machaon TaxID=76193 RepID=A0A194QZ34_PAPMA|nr:Proteasome assembly chaperone 2 [Papilio machaon]
MSPSHYWKFIDESDLSGYSLIIPSVAVGNVGQLACDLIISSLKMKKIATVYSPAFIPVLGYDPYDLKSKSLSSSCEVYICDSRKIVVLQIRAPLVYKFAQSFLENIVQIFKEKNVQNVVLLTSSYAHEKKHISTSPFRYICTESTPYDNEVNELKWTKHDQEEGRLKIFGGGFASMFFEICKNKSLPCFILYKFCSEGDNSPDAYDMVYHLNKIVPLFSQDKDFSSQLKQPVSWKLLFGRPPPKDIY